MDGQTAFPSIFNSICLCRMVFEKIWKQIQFNWTHPNALFEIILGSSLECCRKYGEIAYRRNCSSDITRCVSMFFHHGKLSLNTYWLAITFRHEMFLASVGQISSKLLKWKRIAKILKISISFIRIDLLMLINIGHMLNGFSLCFKSWKYS